MRGSAPSAGSITRLSRGTVFAAGLYVRTGTKTSPDSPIPFPFPTSRHAALSPPTTRKTTATQASMSQTAAGRCLILSSCPPAPQLTDRCPLCLWCEARARGPPPATRMSSSQKERVRKIWAWRLKKLGPRLFWSLASSVECDRVTEI